MPHGHVTGVAQGKVCDCSVLFGTNSTQNGAFSAQFAIILLLLTPDVTCETTDGVWIAEWIYCPLRTTSHGSATADHKSPQHPLNLFQPVFTSRSTTTASNSWNSAASRAQVLSSQPQVQKCLWSVPCLYHPGTDHTENTPFPTVTIVACVFVAAGTCLSSRCPETVFVYRVSA
jgi:hypothetical protein